MQRNRPRSSISGAAPKAAGSIGRASLTMSQTRRRRFYIFVQVLLARLAREDVDRLNRAKEVSTRRAELVYLARIVGLPPIICGSLYLHAGQAT